MRKIRLRPVSYTHLRVTPFNAQDLKVAGDAVTLINSYFNGIELVAVIVGVAAVVVWVISMWKRGGQYAGKMRRVLAPVSYTHLEELSCI